MSIHLLHLLRRQLRQLLLRPLLWLLELTLGVSGGILLGSDVLLHWALLLLLLRMLLLLLLEHLVWHGCLAGLRTLRSSHLCPEMRRVHHCRVSSQVLLLRSSILGRCILHFLLLLTLLTLLLTLLSLLLSLLSEKLLLMRNNLLLLLLSKLLRLRMRLRHRTLIMLHLCLCLSLPNKRTAPRRHIHPRLRPCLHCSPRCIRLCLWRRPPVRLLLLLLLSSEERSLVPLLWIETLRNHRVVRGHLLWSRLLLARFRLAWLAGCGWGLQKLRRRYLGLELLGDRSTRSLRLISDLVLLWLSLRLRVGDLQLLLSLVLSLHLLWMHRLLLRRYLHRLWLQ